MGERIEIRSSGSNLSVSWVVLAFARPDSTLDLIRRIRNELPAAPVLVFVDLPKDGASSHVTEQNSRLIRELDYMAANDYCLKFDVANVNLGTTLNLIRGLDEASKDSGAFVVLEDDCMPVRNFFVYAQAALDLIASKRYDLVSFTGANHLLPPFSSLAKTGLKSELTHVWGWGMPSTPWSDLRRFLLEPPEVEVLAQIADQINSRLVYRVYRRYWLSLLDQDWLELSWDYKYQFWIWIQGGTVLVPGRNLITNVGQDGVATNSSQIADHFQNRIKGNFRLQNLLEMPPRLLTFWELTGYRFFALKRLLKMSIHKKLGR